MTTGGFSIIVAGVLLGFLGWAAAAYTSYQVRQHRAQSGSARGGVTPGDERVVSIDVVGDFVMTARQTHAGAVPPAYTNSMRRSTGPLDSGTHARPKAGLKIPRDPDTGRILKMEQLPVRAMQGSKQADQPLGPGI